MNAEKTGVLLLNFGAPESLDQVEAFITHICQGRKLPEQVLEMTKRKYASIGGSPLISTAEKQAKGLEHELRRHGRGYPVYIGMLHSKPFIADTVEQMVKDGIKRILAVSMAPFYSEVSTGAYYNQVEKSVPDSCSDVNISYAHDWYLHPSFIDAWVRKISQALEQFTHPEEINLIFTTHSLPMEPAADALRYQRQYREAAGAVVNKLSHEKFYLAYQSKGKGLGNWLTPLVEEVIEKLAGAGEKHVLVIPIGFVADHLETLYDLDIEIKKEAAQLKIDFHRTSTFNDDPDFIKFLVELVLAIME